MKRVFIVMLFSVLFLFGACQSPEEDMVVEETTVQTFDISEEEFLYEGTEGVDVTAVDENGYLYTITCMTETEDIVMIDGVIQPVKQQVRVYDLTGACVKEVELALGTGNISLLTAKDGKLYCIASKSDETSWGPTLCSIDTSTWEVEELYFFENYVTMINFAPIGDYFYVIGWLKDAPDKEYTLHPDIDNYVYQGECVSRVKLGQENPKAQILPIDFPMDIVGTKKDTLLIYHYNEEKGFGFLEFDPKQEILQEVGFRKKKDSLNALMQCKDGFLFRRASNIYYGTIAGIETKLSNKTAMGKFSYQKSFLFYITPDGVERMGVDSLIKGNTPIRMLLSDEYNSYMREPYHNGYLVTKTVLEPQEYALKVLAQDTDFDMYLLESRESVSYNIKEKGAFYALNEVEGVMEYLDACFPYIKEVATNEEGDIWMIPVETSIFMLGYYKAFNEENGVDLEEMNFLEFLQFVEEVEVKEPEKGSISLRMLIESMFLQYLSKYDSFDTDVFRQYAKQLKQIDNNAGHIVADTFYVEAVRMWNNLGQDPTYTQEELEQIVPFYYDFQVYVESFRGFQERLGTSDMIGITKIPRISEELGNIGVLTFLCVNPQSENLSFVLEYISDFCKYMLKQKDTFLLQEESTYTDTPLTKECYEVYKEGSIAFTMDDNVYWDTFWNYIDGKIGLEEMVEEIERKYQIFVGE